MSKKYAPFSCKWYEGMNQKLFNDYTKETMNSYTRYTGLIMVLAILLSSCATQKVVVMHQDVAATAEAEGNYAAATEAWDNYFEQQLKKGEEVAPEIYSRAGQSAFKAGRKELAKSWFSLAKSKDYSDPGMLWLLAKMYLEENQLHKELKELELFREKYPQDEVIDQVNVRLFEIYIVTGQDEKAIEIWDSLLENDRLTEEYLDNYFELVLKKDDDAKADSIAEKLVEVNPNHIKALEWLGERYYHKAENHYQKELADYKKNHTHLQYLHLNKQLKIINANFKKSLDHFSRLWEIEQKKVYAGYLANIYARFENTRKADYYRQFAK